MSTTLPGVIVEVELDDVWRELTEGTCRCGTERLGAGEPVADRPVGMILLGNGLS